MFQPVIISAISLIAWSTLFGQASNKLAPGAPGHNAHWPSAAKNGFGTSNTLTSKVWFTLTNGVMSEVFYPTLDVPNVQTLQLVIVEDGNVQTEGEDTLHRMDVLDAEALSFRQVNTAKDGNYTITKTYVTDPRWSSVLIDVNIDWHASRACDCAVYLYYDPSLNNSGMHDSAAIDGAWLVASDDDKSSALTVLGTTLTNASNGYLGTSDGLTQLRKDNRITPFSRAVDGNVVQTARVELPSGVKRAQTHFTIVIGFGRSPREAMQTGQASATRGFEVVRSEYERGWHDYVRRLPRVEQKYQRQFNMAAMVLKGLEDKTYRGAMIASPSVPWGGGPNANEPTVSGYHAVWSRDLYHVATAFQAIGDSAAANRALSYLFKVQQKPDGSFPQNSRVDGKTLGQGLQMDQVAFPLIMAYELGRTEQTIWSKHIKPAADFIVRNGPTTNQDRWEEEAGYSPASMAAQIAGLVCAARVATLYGEATSAELYLRTADAWATVVEARTVTRNGPHARGRYYLRMTQGDPNQRAPVEINSGGGNYDQREIVDAGFLELVRLGIKTANDPAIVDSLRVVDRLIRATTPNGPGWYRYNHDAYGERNDGGDYDGRTGRGRLWTLLTGERGEYELARGDTAKARASLDAMVSFANDGMMIPEQVWDRAGDKGFQFGEGTGSATPLAWSMAQFIRLAMNIRAKRNLETPAIVRGRYLKRTKQK